MSYPSDGRNHQKAIDSEMNLSKYTFELETIFNKKIKSFEHLGGTKNKIDVLILFIDNTIEKITLKSKKNINVGSFDWVNTTDFPKNQFYNSYDIFNRYRGSNNTNHKKLLENAISDELNNISSDSLTDIFMNQVCLNYSNNNLKLLIIDEKTNTIFKIYPKIFELLHNGYKLKIKQGKGKTSSKVLCEDMEGLQIDLGLRVRLHLNNGWTKWKKGQNSFLCLKFQQDKVFEMINE